MSSREQSMYINETKMAKHTHHDNLVTVLSHKKNTQLQNAQYLFNNAVQYPYIEMD